VSRLRVHVTYANVMATVAVFLALGGISYAATQLPKNSVGSKQLKKGSVGTAKIKDEAVTAAKVKKGALTGAQIDASTLGTVPRAAVADSANHAATADSATKAATADSATRASSAGDADALGGLGSDAYAKTVASGSFPYDPPSLSAGSCTYVKSISVPNAETGDVIVATPQYISGFAYTFGLNTVLFTGEPGHVEILACNHGSGALNQDPIEINWQLLR
jgi:hypothetical protein